MGEGLVGDRARAGHDVVSARLRRLLAGALGPFRRRHFERELADELQATLDALVAEEVAEGVPLEEARRRAGVALGGVEQVKEEVRAARAGAQIELFAQDARFALRSLRRSPGYAAAALLTLALGIGGAASVFSVVRAVSRPPAYPQAERLVHLWATWPGGAGNFGYPDFRALVDGNRSFEKIAAYETWGSVALTGRERPEMLRPSFVTADYFELLGGRALAGRLFGGEENGLVAGGAVTVISHDAWRSRFGGDPAIVGRALSLNGRPYTVVGVMAPEFRDLGQAEHGVPAPDLWLPAAAAPQLIGQPPLTDPYSIYWGEARLRPGVTLDEARRNLAEVAAARAAAEPTARARHGLELQSLRERLAGPVSRPAYLLFGGATFILLLGCVNLASASLLRLERRRAEIALRSALGASSARLVRQLLVEAALLAAAGALAGTALAIGLTRLFGNWVRGNVAALVVPRVDVWVLLCALGLALGTMALFGVLPALVGRRVDLRAALASGGTRGATAGPSRLRRAMAVVQVALATVLLVGAGLMGRSLARLLGQPMGYDTAELLTLRIDLSGDRYADGPARARFASLFEETVRTLPGVRSVSLWGPSMLGKATWVVSVFPAERAPSGPNDFVQAFRHSVNPGALANLGLPLRSGRELARSDVAGAPLVAVISETLARQLWPGEDAVGKRLRRVDPALAPITVVGVAGDAQHRDRYSLGDVAAGIGPCGVGPQRDIYLPFAQRPNPSLTAAVRFSGDNAALGAAIAGAVARLDRDLPVSDVALLDHRLARQASAPAAIASLFAAFATFAAFLAALGLYGVIAQSVEMRARELGIRLALGAGAGALVRREVRAGSAFAGLGAALGVLGAIACVRFLDALLFGVSARDPWTFGGVVVFLVALAAVTAFVPARGVIRRGALLALRE